MRIFFDNEHLIHAKGVEPIPFYPFSNIPNVKNVSMYGKSGVPVDLKDRWITSCGDYNIGCVAGEQSGVVFVQVHTKDQKIRSLIEEILPRTPWEMTDNGTTVYAYRYSPEAETFSIMLQLDESLVVTLKGLGEAQLLPPSKPSLHSLALEASCELVPNELPLLHPQFEEILNGILSSEKVKLKPTGHSNTKEDIPMGVREFKLREMAQVLANDTLSGSRTMQECFGILASLSEQLVCPEEDLSMAMDCYQSYIAQDMELFGRSLPKTWKVGLVDPNSTSFGEKETEKTHSELKQKVYADITATFDDDEGRLIAVQNTLSDMNMAPSLDEIQEDLLIRYIAKQANLGLTVATLRRRLKSLNTGTCPGDNQTEIAMAFLKYVSRVCPFAYYNNGLWRFTGANWEEISEGAMTNLLANNFGHLPAAKRSGDHNGILRIFKAQLPDFIRHPSFENTDGINFSNGYLRDDLKLIPHSPSLGAQYVLPFPYDPSKADSANRPMFNKFLEDCWGLDADYKDKVEALREAIAITMFGMAHKYQKVFLLFGVPKSGKSQLLNIISSLVPTAAKTSLPPTEWAERFRSAQLHGKILNIAGELSEHRLIEGQVFKDIVDGTEQLGEHKGTNFFRFVPKCAHWFASNHFPKTKDTSEGFTRRWHILQFKKSVQDGATIVRDLGNLIAARERDSIVAWAIESLPSLTQRGEYTIPESHIESIGDVASQNNSVRFFMTGSGLVQVANPSLKGTLATLTPEQLKSLPYLAGNVLQIAYSSFALGAGGVRPVSSAKFHQMMLELCDQMGIVQKRVRHQNGRTMFAYFNLKLCEATPESMLNENSESPTKLTMEEMIGINPIN